MRLKALIFFLLATCPSISIAETKPWRKEPRFSYYHYPKEDERLRKLLRKVVADLNERIKADRERWAREASPGKPARKPKTRDELQRELKIKFEHGLN